MSAWNNLGSASRLYRQGRDNAEAGPPTRARVTCSTPPAGIRPGWLGERRTVAGNLVPADNIRSRIGRSDCPVAMVLATGRCQTSPSGLIRRRRGGASRCSVAVEGLPGHLRQRRNQVSLDRL